MKVPKTENGRKIYIAGPMRGLPDFNYQKFNAVEAELAANGWNVSNPVKIGEKFGTAEEINGSAILLEAVMQSELLAVKLADAIFLLRGWQHSEGARMELAAALEKSADVYLEENDAPAYDPNLVGYIRSTFNDAFDRWSRADDKFKRTDGALQLALKENDEARAAVEKLGAEMSAAKKYIEGAKK